VDCLFDSQEVARLEGGQVGRSNSTRPHYEPYGRSASQLRQVDPAVQGRSQLQHSVAEGEAKGDRRDIVAGVDGPAHQSSPNLERTGLGEGRREADEAPRATLGDQGPDSLRRERGSDDAGVGIQRPRWRYLRHWVEVTFLGGSQRPVPDGVDPFEETFACEAWGVLLKQYRRVGERDAYLYDNRDDAETAKLTAKANKSAVRFGELRDALIAWSNAPPHAFMKLFGDVALAEMERTREAEDSAHSSEHTEATA
jgi:hypothetical protein